MSSMPFRSSRPDSWTTPQPHTDATMRMMKYGKIQIYYIGIRHSTQIVN